MANLEIRKAASDKKVFLWQVAEQIGVTDFTLSRKLRRELNSEDKEKIMAAIDQIAAAREE